MTRPRKNLNRSHVTFFIKFHPKTNFHPNNIFHPSTIFIYNFSGGAPRIGDLFEFIHQFYVDSEYTKTGIPLNVVLISDGQTQGDDKENMEKWTKILKRVSFIFLVTSGKIEAYFRFMKHVRSFFYSCFDEVAFDG